MHHQSHAVIRLALHLPLQQPVYFTQGQEEAALDRATARHTHLTAWFQLNQENEEARQYLYPDIPHHFVYNQTTRKWQKRKRFNKPVVARMYTASPRNLELFHLRVLLLHKPGATSYEDLKTIDDQTADTFKEACKLMGLLADDTEWNQALTEASSFQMPSQMRSLFAMICAQCHPTEPATLWMTHKEAMVEDYYQHHTATTAESLALQDIEAILSQSGNITFSLSKHDRMFSILIHRTKK